MRKKILALGLIVSLVSSAWGASNYVVAETSEKQVYEGEQSAGKEIEEQELTTDEIPDALGITENEKKDITDKYTKRLYNEERNLNTVMFENEDGERTMYMFKHPVKFEDENGNIVDKDVHFEELGDECGIRIKKRYICDNGDNDVKVYMPNRITYGINIETDENSIQMAVDENYNRDAEVIVEDNYVMYDEVFGEATSVKYTPLLNGIKEEIILEEFTGQTEFEFTLRLDGYELVTLDDNCLYLENKEDGEIEGIIDSVYMIDANGDTNFNNYYTYEELAEGYYKLVVHVDGTFLSSEDTEYPVIIDPPLTLNKEDYPTAIYDATLNSTSTTAGTSGSLFVGNRSNTENGISRAVMKFPGLDFDELNVSVVLEAKVSIRDLMCESDEMKVMCYALLGVNDDWNESNVNWDYLNMASYPYTTIGKDEQVVSYNNGLNQSQAHRYEFDVTEYVYQWRRGRSDVNQNMGLIFRAENENEVISKTFGSYNRASNNPVFEMKYVKYSKECYPESRFLELLKDAEEIYPQSSRPQFKFNCLGMALKKIEYIDYDELGIVSESDKRDVNKMADAIVDYVNAKKCNDILSAVKVGDKTAAGNIAVTGKQYYVALRVNESLINGCGFHIIAQTNTGTWINKHGQELIQRLGYIDPDIDEQPCWYNAKDDYYHDSDTVYILLTIKGVL